MPEGWDVRGVPEMNKPESRPRWNIPRPKRGEITIEWWEASRSALLASKMSEQELDILRKRDIEGMSGEAIGKVYGVGRARVSQVYRRARRKLSHPLRSDFLGKYKPVTLLR